MTSQELPPVRSFRKGERIEFVTEFILLRYMNAEFIFDGDDLTDFTASHDWDIPEIQTKLKQSQGLFYAIEDVLHA